MGFFNKDWAKELERAEGLLADDLPVPALELAQRAERKAGPDLQSQAASLVLRARRALLTSVLAKTDAAEEAGDLEDAADWLLSAIDNESSPIRRAEFEARREALLKRDFERESPFLTENATLSIVAGESTEPDVAFLYETLVNMLEEGTRELYAGRSAQFQAAWVDLNQGRTDRALEVLGALAAAAPDDAVLRLEAGRARLMAGDAVGARADFEAAWPSLGDEPLDTHGELFLPALWAESCLADGDADAVIERLGDLARTEAATPSLIYLYGRALLDERQATRAAEYLGEAASFRPTDTALAVLLAEALVATSDPESAVAVLERAIAPSCAGGCASPSLDLVAIRILARLHVGQGGSPARARELIAIVASATHGHLAAGDYEILAAYYGTTGDAAAAADSRAESARLAAAGAAAVASLDTDFEAADDAAFAPDTSAASDGGED